MNIDAVYNWVATDARWQNYTRIRPENGRIEIGPVEYANPAHAPWALVLIWPRHWPAWTRDEARMRYLTRIRSQACIFVIFGTDDEFVRVRAEVGEEAPVVFMPLPTNELRLGAVLAHAQACARLSWQRMSAEQQLKDERSQNQMLIKVGQALSQERDLRSLLDLILRRAREVTGADAGSIYVVESIDGRDDTRRLRFKVAQNQSIARIERESRDFTMEVSDKSIVGLCVLTRENINIPDLYRLDPPGVGNNPWGLIHDRSFDERHGYQTRSMLTVPMISARSQVIGVIQLINRRPPGHDGTPLSPTTDFDSSVIPFGPDTERYAMSLASQAGISLENAKLYEEVRTLFEGFVHASVTAIESRDPTTSGHSERVADLTTALAKVVDRVDTGPYASTRFPLDQIKQLEYAALLHDFGKVGVSEHILVKAKKLYPAQIELIRQRFKYIKVLVEKQALESKVFRLSQALLEDHARTQLEEFLRTVDRETEAKLEEIDTFLGIVNAANEPSILDQRGCEQLAALANHRFLDIDGGERSYLVPEEVKALQVLRGSLTGEERIQIQEHVNHTIKFLKKIPWGRMFRDVPEIAGGHHEKLDGSGYPAGLSGDAITPQMRMMTIADIYDALTASDRPYKRAVPAQRALDILHDESRKGRLDGELLRLFVESGVYNRGKDKPNR